MNFDRISDIRPEPDMPVTMKFCGKVIEIQYMQHSSSGCPIEKISADHYIDTRTGEVLDFQHKDNRAENKGSVAQSLRNLRDLINTNLENPKNALWITLTYAQNMRDSARLYEDFRRFWMRFRYFLNKQGLPPAEYIVAAEPQARGAWHLHGLFLFPNKAPYIPNAEIARIWGHGFTKTKSLKGIDNPGLYLTAYLGDMELSEAISAGSTRGRITAASTTDEQGQQQKKAIIKGARLRLYPPGFHLYRCSRGVKRPEIYRTTEAQAQKIIGSAPLTYEKTISITDGAGAVKNIINYRQFNIARKEEQQPAQQQSTF